MIEHSEQLNELAEALAKAQAEVRGAIKDANNPHFNRKYADLGSVWDAMRGPFTSNGLSVVQFPGFTDGKIAVTTMLLHKSGQWLKETAAVPFEKEAGRNASQSVGSAVTYLRRYSLAAVGSVCPEDDDAEGAGPKYSAKRQAALKAEILKPPAVSPVREPPSVPDKKVVKLSEDQKHRLYERAAGDEALVHGVVAQVTGKPCTVTDWPPILLDQFSAITDAIDAALDLKRLPPAVSDMDEAEDLKQRVDRLLDDESIPKEARELYRGMWAKLHFTADAADARRMIGNLEKARKAAATV